MSKRIIKLIGLLILALVCISGCTERDVPTYTLYAEAWPSDTLIDKGYYNQSVEIIPNNRRNAMNTVLKTADNKRIFFESRSYFYRVYVVDHTTKEQVYLIEYLGYDD